MSQIPSPYDPTHGHHHQEHMHSEHCGLCRIELEHVSVSAGGDTLLSNVNMHIHCGQLTALVGPNGAGKTTLVRALLSQIPHTGQIRHMDNQERPLRSVRTGYVPQQLPFDKQMPVTVTDFLAASLTRRPVWTGVGKKTRAQVLEALALARAEKLANRQLGQLSGGELQRVLLALALTPQPDLLILDEWGYVPIDKDGSQLLFRVISDSYESKSLILTTNLEFSKWGGIFTDDQMAAAMIDRLVHHGHLLIFEGKSYRMEHALMRQDV